METSSKNRSQATFNIKPHARNEFRNYCCLQIKEKRAYGFNSLASDLPKTSTMPTAQQAELHHSANARFQSGNRVYRIVILGQGGVGKSGESVNPEFVCDFLFEWCAL